MRDDLRRRDPAQLSAGGQVTTAGQPEEKPGGKLIATYWLEMQMLPLLGEVMTAVLGQTPPPPPQNPLSLKEPGLFEDMLVTAGFETPPVMESSYPFNIGTDPDFQYKLCVAVEPS